MQQLDELIEGLPGQYPVDPQRIFLAGFSKGALMSGCFTLAKPGLVAATAMLSGYLPLQSSPATHQAGIKSKPIFVAHGSYDNVLPVALGRQARLHLEGLEAEVEYH